MIATATATTTTTTCTEHEHSNDCPIWQTQLDLKSLLLSCSTGRCRTSCGVEFYATKTLRDDVGVGDHLVFDDGVIEVLSIEVRDHMVGGAESGGPEPFYSFVHKDGQTEFWPFDWAVWSI